MRTISVKLPDELVERLNSRAKALNRPRSEIIRRNLESEFNGRKSESLLDRAGDLVGKYSGSKHSSHKRNLKNFGLKSLASWKRS